MKKPQHQWQTRRHVAVRLAEHPGAAWSDDPRAEAFDLDFAGRAPGRAVCGLAGQTVDAESWAEDPDLMHAIGCWVVARGGRKLSIRDEEGRSLHQGSVTPASLGDEPTATRRLVTLCPSNAELVDALQCFDRVVACEDSSDYPPEVTELERLGPDLGVDVDRIAAVQPDLVLSSLTVPGMERNVTALRARGVPQVVLAPLGLHDVLDEVSTVGEILGVEAQARRIRAEMEAEIERLRADCPTPPVRVYLEWWPRPMFSPGGQCYSNELIELAGGVNVFKGRRGSSLQISVEDLVSADPAIAFVSWCGVAADKLDPARVLGRPGVQHVDAIRHRRVFPVDEAFAGRPGPRMLEAARIMQRHIKDVIDDRA